MFNLLLKLVLFFFGFFYTKQGLLTYDIRNFYCNRRIYSDNNGLSIHEINSLCSKITSDDRFMLLFTNQDRFNDEKSYGYNCEDFFNTRCSSNLINCKYNFAICIIYMGVN